MSEKTDHDLLIRLEGKIDGVCKVVTEIKDDQKELNKNIKDILKSKVSYVVFFAAFGIVVTILTILMPYSAHNREMTVENKTKIEQHLIVDQPEHTHQSDSG